MANHITKKKRPLAIQPTTPERQSEWPKWLYHPKSGQGAIFRSGDEVPSGWVEDYAKTDKGKAELKGQQEQAGTAGSTHASLYYKAGSGDDADTGDDDDDNGGGGSDEPEELEDIDAIEIGEIKKRLTKRGIPFAANASKATVYQLLEENWIEE